MIYTLPIAWLVIALAGIIGCVATAIAVRIAAGIPIKAVAGNPGKLLWSVIFAIPLPILLSIGGAASGLFISWLFLAMAPSLASKFHFGPKDIPFYLLMIYNSVYAVTAIVVFLAAGRLL